MSIGESVIYSLLGLSVVFVALICLLIMVKILTKLMPVPAQEIAPPASHTMPMPEASGTAGELALHDVDPRQAAMVMAIVADELQTPLNELRFTSIKEIKLEEEEDEV